LNHFSGVAIKSNKYFIKHWNLFCQLWYSTRNNNNDNIGEHLYSALTLIITPIDQVSISDYLKPSLLPGKYTVQLTVRHTKTTSSVTISCTVWYRVPFYCRVDRRGSDEIWTRELSHGRQASGLTTAPPRSPIVKHDNFIAHQIEKNLRMMQP